MRNRVFVERFLSGLLSAVLISCASSAVSQAAGNGSATTTGTVTVPVATVVSCTGSTVTVAPGTRTSTLTVTCTLIGNPSSLVSSANGFIYPATLANGSKTLTLTPVAGVTSPDGSVINISGTYNAFNGTLRTGTGNVWKIQSTATVNTTSATPAGTYTGVATYNWSTL